MMKERFQSQLEKDSYRLTPQREAVLEVLIAHADDHLSAEEIFFAYQENLS